MMKPWPTGLLDATVLTRQGRLADATAAIQRALARHARPSPCANPEERVVEGGPGRFISGLYAGRTGSRPYKLYIPAAAGGEARPLIVMLHGCTQTPDDFAAGTRMNAAAEECGYFVLYPEQTCGANHSRCWNWFKRGDQKRDSGEPAILAGMTREIMSRYGIDPRRVYAAGLSAGGAMAAVMGEAYPELFAAIGVHSGLAAGTAHDVPSAFAAMRGATAAPGRAAQRRTARLVPAILFHGDRDTTVHPSNSEQQIPPLVRGERSVERGRVPGGHAYTRSVHSDPAGRVTLEHWLVHGAGHAWSGGSKSGSYTDPKGPDATRAMLRFFAQHENPGRDG